MGHLTTFISLYLIIVAVTVSCHSWVENIQKIDPRGQFFAEIGYIRNFTARVANQDVDQRNTYELLNTSPEQIFCSPFQTSHFQANEFPRLEASPGSQIVAQYLENGHISTPVSPLSVVGDISWFGIESNDIFSEDVTSFGEVLSWKDGVGEGLFLGVTPFDDGICGRGDPALPCRSTLQIPSDATVGSLYTLYWLWDYSGKLGPNTGHVEFYTSCMDIDIVS